MRNRSRLVAIPATAVSLLISVAVMAERAPAEPTTEQINRLSLKSDGSQASSLGQGEMSDDGRWVVIASGEDLIVGDEDGDGEDDEGGGSFLKNVDTGQLTRLTKYTPYYSLSADGSLGAFELNTAPVNDGQDAGVFVQDMATRNFTRVAAFDFDPGQGGDVEMSADGSTVAFVKFSDGSLSDAALYTVPSIGGPAKLVHDYPAGFSRFYFDISADGRSVAFQTSDESIDPSYNNGVDDVFVKDMDTGSTRMVSLDSNRTNRYQFSERPLISGDGRYVAWESSANFAGDKFIIEDRIYRKDLQTEKVKLISKNDHGAAVFSSISGLYSDALSLDGKVIAFDDLEKDVTVVRDISTGAVEAIAPGKQVSDADLSTHGNAILFESTDSEIVPGDTNGTWDVFQKGGPECPEGLDVCLPVYALEDVDPEAVVNTFAAALGVKGDVVERDDTLNIFEAGTNQSLTIFRDSGAAIFVDEDRYGRAQIDLPSRDKAKKVAKGIVGDLGLLDGDPTSTVSTEPAHEGSGSAARVVTFEYKIERLPVRDGDVTVWVGNGGRILRLESNYRRWEEPPEFVEARTEDDAMAEMATLVSTTDGLELQTSYVVMDPGSGQAFLDPVYVAVDELGNVAATARATSFAPILEYLAPDTSETFGSDRPILFRASATEGHPPYTFSWSSDLDGPLGEGETFSAQLSPGMHLIQLSVRDERGATSAGAVRLYVVGEAVEAAARARAPSHAGQSPEVHAPTPVATGALVRFDNGYSATVERDPHYPLRLSNVQFGGLQRIDNVWVDQIWSTISVFKPGTDTEFRLSSKKCFAPSQAGNSCTLPRAPFAQTEGAGQNTFDPLTSTISTSVRITNVPGTLTFNIQYSGSSEFCGPSPPLGLNKVLWVVGSRQFGGTCPGIRPMVTWAYEPPDSLTAGTIWQYCTQSPEGSLCDIPPGDLDQMKDSAEPWSIRDFELKVLTAIQPHTRGGSSATLVKDEKEISPLPSKLRKTDGPLDDKTQPFWAINDAFKTIKPIALERTGLLVQKQTFEQSPGDNAIRWVPGEWDNVHVKEDVSLKGVIFPGCNWNLANDVREGDPRGGDTDSASCLHFHEQWIGETPGPEETYSRGQEVKMYILRFRSEERHPNHPASITNGESLRRPRGHSGWELILWHESTANSSTCHPLRKSYPIGGPAASDVNNAQRPCIVFPNGLFFTPASVGGH